MVWCSSCAKNVVGYRPYDSQLCCDFCGRVIENDNFSHEPTFVKNAAGQSQLSGNFIRSIQSEYGASRERLLEKAFDDMRMMKTALEMGENDEIVHIAKRLYGIAVARNFTRGRRTELVQASCLYIACREKRKPFLLIDFSNYLNINVYELGAVYLQLCQVLYLADESNVQKLVDPSIFLHKFTDRLLPGGNKKVCDTARDILASMKRDWMTTGRKPSGLCGAALYISALTHGLKFSKSDIVKIVHICEATLTKRLVEFENTDSGGLTIEEFLAKKKERGGNFSVKQPKISGTNEVLCKHKKSGKPFAYGLCKDCYDEFMTISEGLEGGSDPPAFQLAERERMAKESAEDNTTLESELESPFLSRCGKAQSAQPGCIGNTTNKAGNIENNNDKPAGVLSEDSDGSDNFSDIDDFEVDGYLHNEEEKQYKKIIWEEMNREYLEEQAAKEAAAAAAKAAFEANFKDNPEGLKAAQELAAAAAAVVAQSRKERQQKRAEEAKTAGPAQTAAEAARQMLIKKRLSSKINYDVLEKLFDAPADKENSKKQKSDNDDDMVPNRETKKDNLENKMETDDFGPEGDFGDEEDAGEEYGNDLDYGNADEGYDYGGYDYDEF